MVKTLTILFTFSLNRVLIFKTILFILSLLTLLFEINHKYSSDIKSLSLNLYLLDLLPYINSLNVISLVVLFTYKYLLLTGFFIK